MNAPRTQHEAVISFIRHIYAQLQEYIDEDSIKEDSSFRKIRDAITLDDGQLIIQKESEEMFRTFIEILIQHTAQATGAKQANTLLQTAFSTFSGADEAQDDLLSLIPNPYLEKKKSRGLSKEELHTRLLKRTQEYLELTTDMEAEVKKRVEKLRQTNKELEDVSKTLVRRDIELSEANERLERLDTSKSEFVSVAAHQLRTPLTGIKWTLKALKEEDEGPLNTAQKEIVAGGIEAVTTAIHLVNDLLNISRIEEGRMDLEYENQEITPVVSAAVERIKKRAEEKGITVKFEHNETLPTISFDKQRINMVLNNILDNAIKYTPPGGSVDVSVISNGDDVTISVSDTGIGIPEKQMDEAFTKFFRAKNAVLFETAGTGLGLYLVKRIIDKHGGTVSIDSKENEGTTVSFTLPAE